MKTGNAIFAAFFIVVAIYCYWTGYIALIFVFVAALFLYTGWEHKPFELIKKGSFKGKNKKSKEMQKKQYVKKTKKKTYIQFWSRRSPTKHKKRNIKW